MVVEREMPVAVRATAEAVAEAARRLSAGRVVAVPTDTVYGLAALVRGASAVAKLYAVKGRDALKPLAICVSGVEEVGRWAHTEGVPPGLLAALLPGKVTVVLHRREDTLDPALNPGNSRVGVRVPTSIFLRRVVQKVRGGPVALTSANRSNEASCVRADEFRHLWPLLDGGVFVDDAVDAEDDADRLRAGSTVVDLSAPGRYRVLRPGVCLDAVRERLEAFGLEERPGGSLDL